MALRKDGPNIKQSPFKWVKDTDYECIKSASPGYKVGKVYRSYENAIGVVCLMGDDGFEDIGYMTVSSFKMVK